MHPPPDRLLAAYHAWLAGVEFHDPRWTRRDAPDVARIVGPEPTPMANMAFYTGPLETARFTAAVRQELAFFAALGHGFEWKHVEGLAPEGAEAFLLAQGFVPGDRELALALDLTTAAPLPTECALPVRRLGAADLPQISTLHELIYGGDFSWLTASLTAELAHAPDKITFWGAFDRDLLVASGWLRLDRDGRAALHGGMVHPAHRGRGLFRAIVAHRLADARAAGLHTLLVEASPASRPILERLGFTPLAWTTPYRWTPLEVSPAGDAAGVGSPSSNR